MIINFWIYIQIYKITHIRLKYIVGFSTSITFIPLSLAESDPNYITTFTTGSCRAAAHSGFTSPPQGSHKMRFHPTHSHTHMRTVAAAHISTQGVHIWHPMMTMTLTRQRAAPRRDVNDLTSLCAFWTNRCAQVIYLTFVHLTISTRRAMTEKKNILKTIISPSCALRSFLAFE